MKTGHREHHVQMPRSDTSLVFGETHGRLMSLMWEWKEEIGKRLVCGTGGAGSWRGLSVMQKCLEFILKSLENYSRVSSAS